MFALHAVCKGAKLVKTKESGLLLYVFCVCEQLSLDLEHMHLAFCFCVISLHRLAYSVVLFAGHRNASVHTDAIQDQSTLHVHALLAQRYAKMWPASVRVVPRQAGIYVIGTCAWMAHICMQASCTHGAATTLSAL